MVEVGGKVHDYNFLGPEPFLFDQHSKFLRGQSLGNSPFVRDSWLGCQGQDVSAPCTSPIAWAQKPGSPLRTEFQVQGY